MLGRSGSAELWMGTAPAARKDGWTGPLRGELLADLLADGDLVPVEVEGVRGERFVLSAEVDLLDAAVHPLESPGVAFLAPLDPFVWDREFLRSLFEFDYIWEVYVPEAKRRWGYYVLPILYGDRLVGRIEPRIDRRGDALRIVNLWWEPGFDPSSGVFLDAFSEALEAHRAFAEVRAIAFERPRSHGVIPGAMRDRLSAARVRSRPPAGAGRVGVGR